MQSKASSRQPSSPSKTATSHPPTSMPTSPGSPNPPILTPTSPAAASTPPLLTPPSNSAIEPISNNTLSKSSAAILKKPAAQTPIPSPTFYKLLQEKLESLIKEFRTTFSEEKNSLQPRKIEGGSIKNQEDPLLYHQPGSILIKFLQNTNGAVNQINELITWEEQSKHEDNPNTDKQLKNICKPQFIKPSFNFEDLFTISRYFEDALSQASNVQPSNNKAVKSKSIIEKMTNAVRVIHSSILKDIKTPSSRGGGNFNYLNLDEKTAYTLLSELVVIEISDSSSCETMWQILLAINSDHGAEFIKNNPVLIENIRRLFSLRSYDPIKEHPNLSALLTRHPWMHAFFTPGQLIVYLERIIENFREVFSTEENSLQLRKIVHAPKAAQAVKEQIRVIEPNMVSEPPVATSPKVSKEKSVLESPNVINKTPNNYSPQPANQHSVDNETKYRIEDPLLSHFPGNILLKFRQVIYQKLAQQNKPPFYFEELVTIINFLEHEKPKYCVENSSTIEQEMQKQSYENMLDIMKKFHAMILRDIKTPASRMGGNFNYQKLDDKTAVELLRELVEQDTQESPSGEMMWRVLLAITLDRGAQFVKNNAEFIEIIRGRFSFYTYDPFKAYPAFSALVIQYPWVLALFTPMQLTEFLMICPPESIAELKRKQNFQAKTTSYTDEVYDIGKSLFSTPQEAIDGIAFPTLTAEERNKRVLVNFLVDPRVAIYSRRVIHEALCLDQNNSAVSLRQFLVSTGGYQPDFTPFLKPSALNNLFLEFDDQAIVRHKDFRSIMEITNVAETILNLRAYMEVYNHDGVEREEIKDPALLARARASSIRMPVQDPKLLDRAEAALKRGINPRLYINQANNEIYLLDADVVRGYIEFGWLLERIENDLENGVDARLYFNQKDQIPYLLYELAKRDALFKMSKSRLASLFKSINTDFILETLQLLDPENDSMCCIEIGNMSQIINPKSAVSVLPIANVKEKYLVDKSSGVNFQRFAQLLMADEFLGLRQNWLSYNPRAEELFKQYPFLKEGLSDKSIKATEQALEWGDIDELMDEAARLAAAQQQEHERLVAEVIQELAGATEESMHKVDAIISQLKITHELQAKLAEAQTKRSLAEQQCSKFEKEFNQLQQTLTIKYEEEQLQKKVREDQAALQEETRLKELAELAEERRLQQEQKGLLEEQIILLQAQKDQYEDERLLQQQQKELLAEKNRLRLEQERLFEDRKQLLQQQISKFEQEQLAAKQQATIFEAEKIQLREESEAALLKQAQALQKKYEAEIQNIKLAEQQLRNKLEEEIDRLKKELELTRQEQQQREKSQTEEIARLTQQLDTKRQEETRSSNELVEKAKLFLQNQALKQQERERQEKEHAEQARKEEEARELQELEYKKREEERLANLRARSIAREEAERLKQLEMEKNQHKAAVPEPTKLSEQGNSGQQQGQEAVRVQGIQEPQLERKENTKKTEEVYSIQQDFNPQTSADAKKIKLQSDLEKAKQKEEQLNKRKEEEAKKRALEQAKLEAERLAKQRTEEAQRNAQEEADRLRREQLKKQQKDEQREKQRAEEAAREETRLKQLKEQEQQELRMQLEQAKRLEEERKAAELKKLAAQKMADNSGTEQLPANQEDKKSRDLREAREKALKIQDERNKKFAEAEQKKEELKKKQQEEKLKREQLLEQTRAEEARRRAQEEETQRKRYEEQLQKKREEDELKKQADTVRLQQAQERQKKLDEEIRIKREVAEKERKENEEREARLKEERERKKKLENDAFLSDMEEKTKQRKDDEAARSINREGESDEATVTEDSRMGAHRRLSRDFLRTISSNNVLNHGGLEKARKSNFEIRSVGDFYNRNARMDLLVDDEPEKKVTQKTPAENNGNTVKDNKGVTQKLATPAMEADHGNRAVINSAEKGKNHDESDPVVENARNIRPSLQRTYSAPIVNKNAVPPAATSSPRGTSSQMQLAGSPSSSSTSSVSTSPNAVISPRNGVNQKSVMEGAGKAFAEEEKRRLARIEEQKRIIEERRAKRAAAKQQDRSGAKLSAEESGPKKEIVAQTALPIPVVTQSHVVKPQQPETTGAAPDQGNVAVSTSSINKQNADWRNAGIVLPLKNVGLAFSSEDDAPASALQQTPTASQSTGQLASSNHEMRVQAEPERRNDASILRTQHQPTHNNSVALLKSPPSPSTSPRLADQSQATASSSSPRTEDQISSNASSGSPRTRGGVKNFLAGKIPLLSPKKKPDSTTPPASPSSQDRAGKNFQEADQLNGERIDSIARTLPNSKMGSN